MNIWQTSITYIYGAVEKTKLFSFKRKTLQVGILVVHYKTKDTSSHFNKKPVLGNEPMQGFLLEPQLL